MLNLTEVVVRSEDTYESLEKKVTLATFLGTFQATLTNFQFLNPEWASNCEEERLLGVSLTGVFDHNLLSKSTGDAPIWLDKLRKTCVEANKKYAEEMGINAAGAITCVKPSGTVSQLVDCASGIHPRHSAYYVRNIRLDIKDPVCKFLENSGVKCEADRSYPNTVKVFSFPMKSSEGVKTRNDITAIEHLKVWMMYQKHWCEHKPSVTISVDEHEWMEVGAYVYKHFDEISGVSFLPKSNHTYIQAPYEECSEDVYNALKAATPIIDWEKFVEKEDETTSSQELACVGGVCEIVGL